MRRAIRIIGCLSFVLAGAGIASPARAGCYPPPCAAPAAAPGQPAAPAVQVAQPSADPVDSRSPAPVVAFALLLVMATLATLCLSRYQQLAMAAAELEDDLAAEPTAVKQAERSVA